MIRPTLVLVPGAWLPIHAYDDYLKALSSAGFPTAAATYPSFDPSGEDILTADCATDATALRKKVTELVEEGQQIVLILHSYAGMPGAAAAKGLSISERQKAGKSGGVVGLIFVAAFVVPEGLSCAGLQGGNLPPWILLDQPAGGLNVADNPKENFAFDLGDEAADAIVKSLKPHSTLAFKSEQPSPVYSDEGFKGRLAFQVTLEDKAVPKEAQHGMIQGTGQEWIIKELSGSHLAPFAGPLLEESVKQVGEIVDLFAKA